CLQGLQFPLTF
nr:immunoglobulin light chain junction region [Macaca mulatta]